MNNKEKIEHEWSGHISISARKFQCKQRPVELSLTAGHQKQFTHKQENKQLK